MSEVTLGTTTEREIRSQPEVWRITLDQLGARSAPTNASSYLATGCGSTFYVARWLARHAELDVAAPVRAVPASELLLAPRSWSSTPADLPLVAISRSGTTSETVRVLEAWEGPRLAVTCDGGSALAAAARTRIDLDHAAEESVVQTRSFTAMMLGALSLFREVPEGAAEALQAAGTQLLERADALVTDTLDGGVPRRVVVLGSGARYGLANEAALKLTEVALVEAQAFHTLEVRHGPMSMVGEGTLVLGLLDEAEPLEQQVLSDMAALGATIRTVATTPDVADADLAPDRQLPGGWRDVLALPFVHLLGLEMARRAGIDPDQPVNLTAVVTLDA